MPKVFYTFYIFIIFSILFLVRLCNTCPKKNTGKNFDSINNKYEIVIEGGKRYYKLNDTIYAKISPSFKVFWYFNNIDLSKYNTDIKIRINEDHFPSASDTLKQDTIRIQIKARYGPNSFVTESVYLYTTTRQIFGNKTNDSFLVDSSNKEPIKGKLKTIEEKNKPKKVVPPIIVNPEGPTNTSTQIDISDKERGHVENLAKEWFTIKASKGILAANKQLNSSMITLKNLCQCEIYVVFKHNSKKWPNAFTNKSKYTVYEIQQSGKNFTLTFL